MDIFMDMDDHKVSEIIKNNQRFISPFNNLSSYCIVAFDKIELYWNQLKYAEKNIDQFIKRGFHISFYEFYGVNRNIVKSPTDMCQRLLIESFILMNQNTIGCCLSNDEFMFGHFIEYKWDCDWNLIYSSIC